MCERSTAAFAALGLVSLLASQTSANDWNTGTGGNSARNGYVAELGPTTTEILWQGGLPSEIALQAVIEGDIVVMTRIGSMHDKGSTSRIVAQSLSSGALIWDVELERESIVTDWHSRVSAMKNGLVFVTRAGDTNAAFLYALSAVDGSRVWRSQDRIDECSSESLAFSSDGDLIVGNFNSVMRIRASDGTTVWTTPRTSPSSDASSVAVFNNRLYIWEASPEGPRVSVLGADTGLPLYHSAGIGGGFIQQLGLMVGPNGTIYAPRSQNIPGADVLVAFDDSGGVLIEKWRVPLPYVPFASFAVGADNSIYTFSPDHEIVRLNPANGNVLGRSEPIQSDVHQPRMAIGADGILYLTNGGFSEGRLYSFNLDLSTRWTISVPNVNTSGPSLGTDGVLVVCGTGDDVRAFASHGALCPTDWNLDGVQDSLDLFNFLGDFLNGDADYNVDGLTNSDDFFGFMTPFMAGC